ncbi:MAG: cyclic nucleotide-binding domain-containing protein [Verrucomicrobiota bacterium]
MNPIEVLRKHPLFSWISSEPLEWLAKNGQESLFSGHGKIYEDGSNGDAIFIILEGSVNFPSNNGKADISLKEGEVFGECSLIEVRKRAREAQASPSARIFVLSHQVLLDFANKYPDPYSIMVTNLARNLARRIRDLNTQKSSKIASVNKEEK